MNEILVKLMKKNKGNVFSTVQLIDDEDSFEELTLKMVNDSIAIFQDEDYNYYFDVRQIKYFSIPIDEDYVNSENDLKEE